MLLLLKSKTFWTGLAAIATAGAGYTSGEMGGADAIQTAFVGLIGIFLRTGMIKG